MRILALALVFLAAGCASWLSGSRAEPAEVAYASVRIVREPSDKTTLPFIALPLGYEIVPNNEQVELSRSEYWFFLRGPRGTASGCRFSWPDSEFVAVVHDYERLGFIVGDDGSAVSDVPVRAATARDAWTTLEIFTNLDRQGRTVRIEHNDSDRRSGYYAEHAWPAAQVRAALLFVVGSRAMLGDWNPPGSGTFTVLGFETNNPLHGDFPPHWHLLYADDEVDPPLVPHYRLNARGHIFANVVDDERHPDMPPRIVGVGDAFEIEDDSGTPRLATRIRADGGLDIGSRAGVWLYSLTPVTSNGAPESITIARGGALWASVTAHDDVDTGKLTITLSTIGGSVESETYLYDPLTGSPRALAAR